MTSHTGIGKLQCLQSLTLSSNQLKYLPVQLFECHNLLNLHLDSNQLEFVPKEIVKLQKLCELTLSNNQLSFMNPNICLIIENLKGDYNSNPLLCYLSTPYWIKNWPKFDILDQYLSMDDGLEEKTVLLIIKKFKEFYNLQLVWKTGTPSLLELSMEKVYTDILLCSTEECRQQLLKRLPRGICHCFNTPPCFCFGCKKPLFKWAILSGGVNTGLVGFKCSNNC